MQNGTCHLKIQFFDNGEARSKVNLIKTQHIDRTFPTQLNKMYYPLAVVLHTFISARSFFLSVVQLKHSVPITASTVFDGFKGQHKSRLSFYRKKKREREKYRYFV